MNVVIASVAICTQNRADSLARTLESLCGMEHVPSSVYEVVIVDNGSTDHTRKVCNAFAARLRIRYFFEGQRGLSIARNRAIREACGRYICWTDDDVTVDRGWLHAYLRSFAKYAEAAFFGGKITPLLEAPAIQWFAQNYREEPLHYLVALRDLGAEEFLFDNMHMPFGANYAIRMDAQRRFLYDHELGVQPGRNRVGEETAVIKSMMGAGLRGYWIPAAEVFHHISRERQSLQYVEEYFLRHGETSAYLSGHLGRRSVFGAPAWVWRSYAESLCGYYWARAVRDPKVWLLRLRDLGMARGQLKYYLRERSNSRLRARLLQAPAGRRAHGE
ncbi:MAG: glycosyltransferase [Pseudomonadota bacterium]|nr:glycosyltransferase [Pseudomonadota bacterium]